MEIPESQKDTYYGKSGNPDMMVVSVFPVISTTSTWRNDSSINRFTKPYFFFIAVLCCIAKDLLVLWVGGFIPRDSSS